MMTGSIKVGQLYGCKCSPMEFPIAFFEPHRERAYKNHWQSLERLAERGGLGLGEAIAILNGNNNQYVDCPQNEAWLKRRFAEWQAAQKEPVTMDNELVEAVARAICKANGDHWFASDNLTKHNAQHWKLAQAALAATPLASLKAENEALRDALAEAMKCLTWISSLGYGGAPDIAMRKAARETMEHIAALTKQGG